MAKVGRIIIRVYHSHERVADRGHVTSSGDGSITEFARGDLQYQVVGILVAMKEPDVYRFHSLFMHLTFC